MLKIHIMYIIIVNRFMWPIDRKAWWVRLRRWALYALSSGRRGCYAPTLPTLLHSYTPTLPLSHSPPTRRARHVGTLSSLASQLS